MGTTRETGTNMTDQGGVDHFSGDSESGRQNPLTCIRGAYTLASPQEVDANEVDRLMIKHFPDTMAEVALSVASRKVSQ